MKPASIARESMRVDRAAEPEKRLMAAVLHAVVDDLRGSGSAYRRAAGTGPAPNPRVLRAAVAYVVSRDRRWPFSFENICEALSLDTGRLRHELRKAGAPTAPTRTAA